MTFGSKIVPASLQRVRDILLSIGKRNTSFVYLNDVFLYFLTVKEQYDHVGKVLHLLKEALVFFNPRTYTFFNQKLEYPGHIISAIKLKVTK